MGIMFTIDLISTLRYRANDYDVGIDSLFNIIKTILMFICMNISSGLLEIL